MYKKETQTTIGGKAIKVDEYSYYDLALKKKDEGDLIGSLIILHNIAEQGTKNLEVYATMGEVYFEMEAFTMSRECWFKYLSGSSRADVKLRAYSAIGATYCMAMDNYMLGYYYDLEFALKPESEQQYDHILYEYIDYVKEVRPDFFVCFDKGKHSAKGLLAEGERLVEKNDYTAALEKYLQIEPTDEEFEEAVFRAVSCMEYLMRTEDEIVSYLEEQFSKTADNGLIAMLLCEKLEDKDDEKLKKYVDFATRGEYEEPSQYCFLASVYAKLNDLSSADAMIEKGLDLNPYDLKCLFLKGALAYNSGRFDESAECFKIGYDICRDVVNKYYYKEAVAPVKAIERVPYNYALPKDEEKRIISEVSDLIDKPSAIKKRAAGELIDLAEGAFSARSMICAEMIKAFIVYGKGELKRYFTDKLLSQHLDDFAKVFIIEGLVLSGCTKTVAVTVDGVFLNIKLYKAYFEFGNEGVFERAYAKAVAITFAVAKRTDQVLESIYELYYKADENGALNKINEENVSDLAALAIYHSKGNKIKLKQIAKVLSTTEERIEALEKKILETK